MRRVTVIVSKDQLTNFLSYAGQEGLLHLVTVPEKQIPTGASPFETTSLLARSAAIRNRLTTIAPVLRDPTATPELSNVPVQSVEHLAEYLDKGSLSLEQSVKQLETRHEKLQEEKESFVQLSRLLAGLERLGVRLDTISSSGFTTILAGEAPRESVDNIRNELDRLSYGNAIFAITAASDETEAFFAILPSAFQDEAKQALATLGARLELGLAHLPPDPSEARKQVEQRLEQIREGEKQLENDRTKLAKENGPRYASLAIMSEVLEVRAKALSTALATQSTVLLDAWVPEGKFDGFSTGASKVCGDDVSIHVDEYAGERIAKTAHEHSQELIPEHVVGEEPPPTLIDAPAFFKPLQSVVNNFGTPSYHELNPLPFMIFTYPIIYGLMFGDVGQGLLFIIGGLFLWNLKKKGKKIFELGQMIADGSELLILLGIGIVVFGIIFGDLFGFEPDFLKFNIVNGARAPIFSPSELKIEFMVITLFVGVAHLTFGLALSAINKIRNKEYSHAIFGPISWAVFYISGVYLISQVVIAGFKFGIALKPPYVFFLVPIFVSLGLMAWKEGGLHMFEAFLSSASNTFSYLRIWALNIADFEFKFALFIALGVLGAIIGNVLVLIIEGLIVFVQTLRLHWVEWFSKFYEGTGTPFAPYQEPLTGLVVAKKWSNQ
jgi:V/A-type H+-transporting ATPase subunit I